MQNYTRNIVSKDGVIDAPAGSPVTQMGYEFYPYSVANVVKKVSESFKGDIFITENGVATDDDSRRCEYITESLNAIKEVVSEGIPLKGYMYWSLLDNFEWQAGFSKTFGLIAVDRTDMSRHPKESLKVLGSFANR